MKPNKITATRRDEETEKELEELRLQIEQEEEIAKALRLSVADWKITVAQLQKNIDRIMSEDYEWKTRYHCQVEMNNYLEELAKILAMKVKHGKQVLKNSQNYMDKMSDSGIKQLIAQLTREQHNLESELRDKEWRLDQESKAFTRADEKRKAMTLDLKQAKQSLVEDKLKKSLEKLSKVETKLKKKTRKLGPVTTKKYFSDRPKPQQAGQGLHGPSAKPTFSRHHPNKTWSYADNFEARRRHVHFYSIPPTSMIPKNSLRVLEPKKRTILKAGASSRPLPKLK